MNDIALQLIILIDFVKHGIISLKKRYFLFDLILLLAIKLLYSVLVIGVIYGFFDEFLDLSSRRDQEYGIERFIFTVAIHPILEEVASRGFLKNGRWRFSISLGLLTAAFVRIFFVADTNVFFAEKYDFLFTILSIGSLISFTLFFLYKHLSGKIEPFLRNNRPLLIHFSVFVFGILHINQIPTDNPLVFLILLTPHFLFGYFAAFIRIRYSLIHACIFHILSNALVISLG